MRAVILLLFVAPAVWGQALPDPRLTPGALNPAVTQATIKRTICVVGWTATVRPPSSYTTKLKKQQMKLYGDVVPQVPKLAKKHPDLSKCVDHSDDPRCYQEDHAKPLGIGGNPRDPRNLWPQPYFPEPGAYQKDGVDIAVPKLVCSGKITLAEGQAMFDNWLLTYDEMQKAKGK